MQLRHLTCSKNSLRSIYFSVLNNVQFNFYYISLFLFLVYGYDMYILCAINGPPDFIISKEKFEWRIYDESYKCDLIDYPNNCDI
jgi:hypothetical protein